MDDLRLFFWFDSDGTSGSKVCEQCGQQIFCTGSTLKKISEIKYMNNIYLPDDVEADSTRKKRYIYRNYRYIYFNLLFAFFVVVASVITDEIIVVSWSILYDPSRSFVHNVKANWDLSNWYLSIKSFGANLSSWIISKNICFGLIK